VGKFREKWNHREILYFPQNFPIFGGKWAIDGRIIRPFWEQKWEIFGKNIKFSQYFPSVDNIVSDSSRFTSPTVSVEGGSNVSSIESHILDYVLTFALCVNAISGNRSFVTICTHWDFFSQNGYFFTTSANYSLMLRQILILGANNLCIATKLLWMEKHLHLWLKTPSLT